MTLTFVPLLPIWLITLMAVVLLALLAYGSVLLRQKSVPARWVAVLGVLRVVAVALFVLLLLRPVIHYTQSDVDKPDLLVMLDTSSTMGWDEQGERDPRLREAVETLEQSGLRDELEATFELPWFGFEDDARPLDPGRIDALEIARDAQPKDLARSIETAWNHHRLHDAGNARGASDRTRLLLISDGQHDGDDDPVELARRLGLTVYTMPPRDVTPAEPEPGVRVSQFQGTANVLLGSEARFRARLSIEGDLEPGPVELTLKKADETVVTRRVHVDPEQREAHVNLTHQPRTPGRADYELAARPVEDGPAFEPRRPQTLSVNVHARDHQVLLLEDTWRWSFRHLRRVIEDDPNFALTAFISRRPGTYMQFADVERSVALEGFPRSRGELEWFDTIVLGDVNPEHWPSDLAPAIHEMVVERGKSLIVIAGPNLPRLAQVPPLRPLLPVEPHSDRPGYVDGPVEVTPAPGARDSAIFYTPEGDDFFAVFDDLPALDQIYAPLRKRPAANLLLESSEHTNEYGNLIVMAEHTVGRGRVLYLGTDALWQWHTLPARDAQERTPYEVLWHQALRTLAPQRPRDGLAALHLHTDRTRYTVGRRAELSVELEAPAQERRRAEVEVAIELPDDRTLAAALRPHPQRPNVHVAAFEPPVEGPYTITGQAEVDGQVLAETVTRIHVDPRDALARRPNDMATLERLASATGGRVVSPDDPETWPTADDDERRSIEVERSLDLWRNAFLLLLLVGVLGFDWLVRLLRGFV